MLASLRETKHDILLSKQNHNKLIPDLVASPIYAIWLLMYGGQLHLQFYFRKFFLFFLLLFGSQSHYQLAAAACLARNCRVEL